MLRWCLSAPPFISIYSTNRSIESCFVWFKKISETSCALAESRNRLDGSIYFKDVREVKGKKRSDKLWVFKRAVALLRRDTLCTCCFICIWEICPLTPAQSMQSSPPGKITARFDIMTPLQAAASIIRYSYLPFSTFLIQLFSDSLCFHNISCTLPYSHLLNPPSSIKFVFIPPACLPHVFRSPRRHPKHRAPGREPQAGLVAAVWALTGICKL